MRCPMTYSPEVLRTSAPQPTNSRTSRCAVGSDKSARLARSLSDKLRCSPSKASNIASNRDATVTPGAALFPAIPILSRNAIAGTSHLSEHGEAAAGRLDGRAHRPGTHIPRCLLNADWLEQRDPWYQHHQSEPDAPPRYGAAIE